MVEEVGHCWESGWGGDSGSRLSQTYYRAYNRTGVHVSGKNGVGESYVLNDRFSSDLRLNVTVPFGIGSAK